MKRFIFENVTLQLSKPMQLFVRPRHTFVHLHMAVSICYILLAISINSRDLTFNVRVIWDLTLDVGIIWDLIIYVRVVLDLSLDVRVIWDLIFDVGVIWDLTVYVYSITCIQRPLKGSNKSSVLQQVVFKCRFDYLEGVLYQNSSILTRSSYILILTP